MIGCVCLLTLLVVGTRAAGDAEVSCVFMESCILPCSFQGSDVVIHWMLIGGNAPVHAYFHNQDHLARQDQRFKNRTSLFKDQISSGNASLKIKGVKVQDEGRYICSTRGNKDSLINLKVDAPVRDVHIEQVETRITCSSEGIYPEPELTWSTDPPSSEDLQTSTTVQPTEQQLYNISSSLNVTDNVSDLVYICTVRTRRNQRRTTLRQQPSIISSDSETTISCTSTNKTLTDLVWRFNHSQTILTRTRTRTRTRTDDTFRVSEEWKHKVKSVSESGSLTLQDLSTDQEGTYTCELSDEEETNVTDTFLRVKSPVAQNYIIILLLVAAVCALILILVLIIWVLKLTQAQKRWRQKVRMHEMIEEINSVNRSTLHLKKEPDTHNITQDSRFYREMLLSLPNVSEKDPQTNMITIDLINNHDK